MNRDKLAIILGAALFLSLSANFFMAGMMLGRSYGHDREQHEGDRHAEWQKRDEELRKKLSEPDRNILKAAMQQRRPQFQALREALEEAHKKADAAQNAEPFDKAALDAALREESEKKTALIQAMRQARDEIGGQMSPEGRAILNKLGPGARMGGGEGRWRGGEGMGHPDSPGAGGDKPPQNGAGRSDGVQNNPAPQP